MKQKEVLAIAETILGRPSRLGAGIDWYALCGFAGVHRIAGRLADRIPEGAPAAVAAGLRAVRQTQAAWNDVLRAHIVEIGGALDAAGVRYAFLKGSVLSNAEIGGKILYARGERASNDIDVLLSPSDIGAAGTALRGIGFEQGCWNGDKGEVEPFSRAEILSRRMNRGETAPYLRKARGALPFAEVDLNFSLGYLATGDAGLVREMLDARVRYSGLVELYGLAPEHMFLQLLAHQYKESVVLSMIERGKAYSLYKLLDIALMLEDRIFPEDRFLSVVARHNMQREVCVVLAQTAELFRLPCARELAKKIFPAPFPEEVLDPPTGRRYRWNTGLVGRVAECCCSALLEPVR